MGSIEENPSEKATRLIRPSVEPLVLLSCAEHAPRLFYKVGKNLGQNAVGSAVAILVRRLFHVFRRRILTRLGQSEARPDRTHRFLVLMGGAIGVVYGFCFMRAPKLLLVLVAVHVVLALVRTPHLGSLAVD